MQDNSHSHIRFFNVYVFIHLFTRPCMHLRNQSSVHLSLYLAIHLFIHACGHGIAHPPIHLVRAQFLKASKHIIIPFLTALNT